MEQLLNPQQHINEWPIKFLILYDMRFYLLLTLIPRFSHLHPNLFWLYINAFEMIPFVPIQKTKRLLIFQKSILWGNL